MVWLQGTSKMTSWGDAADEWRGLTPLSTHTMCFPTSHGIPNLYEAAAQEAIPDAKIRLLDTELHNKMKAGMHTMHSFFDHFTDENLEDCLAMLALAEGFALPFQWDMEDMKKLYGGGTGVGASEAVANQQAAGLPVGEVGDVYLCRPDESEIDTFLIGIIRFLAAGPKGEPGVKMQWFEMRNFNKNQDQYRSTYYTCLPAATRYTTNLPFLSSLFLELLRAF